MQIEDRQTGIAAFIHPGREKTAAVGEREQITDLSLLPTAIGNPGGQHPIEQVTARRGQQSRTHRPLLRQRLAGGIITSLAKISALIAKTLRAEVIGDALPGNGFKALIQGVLVCIQLSQTQREAIGRMGAALQFAFVPPTLENLQRVILCSGQIRIGLARQLNAEPLAGQCLTILEPGIADCAQLDASSAGQSAGRLFRVQTALLNP